MTSTVPVSARARVLVVEDNPITRKLVRFALEANDFVVLEAKDAHTALTLLASHASDLVLQDIVLPDMDGFELVNQLRALPGGSDIPILAFSGFLSKHDESRMSAAGFNDVIMKPIEPSRLLSVIRAHLPAREAVTGRFGEGRHILVVDDDPVQRKLVCIRLGRLGFETLAASDGIEALDAARLRPPDAIVADVMMPRLDGFGLCVAVRSDATLATTPLILVTNSYIEEADRDLAMRAGANEFVLRTPDMPEVVAALRACLRSGIETRTPTTAAIPGLQEQWARRVMSQLERQVALNAGFAQRCATLSAELSVLSGISDALARHQNIESALTDVLAACFDAGGASLGALYVVSETGRLRVHSFGSRGHWSDDEVNTFFGRLALLRSLIDSPETHALPSGRPNDETDGLLAAARIRSALVVPLRRRDEPFGVLLMASTTCDLNQPDRMTFAQGVAMQITQALALAQAFAEKEASEERSREQATVLRSVLESIAEGVVVTNDLGECLVWNSAAQAILRKGSIDAPPEQWAGLYGISVPGEYRPINAQDLPLVRAMRGESVDQTELFLCPDAGSEGAYLRMSARPLRDEKGAVRGGVAVFRDVTAEKATQAQLMLGDRMASIGTLAAGVAHEINNPLACVLGNVHLVLEQLAEAGESVNGLDLKTVTEMLQDAHDGATRVSQIVRDLRVFSRAEAETLDAVDVHAVLESTLRMASTEIRHRARIEKVYGSIPLVNADEARLGQIFLNLLVNAAQAIPDGQADRNEIRLTTLVDSSGRVVVEVADTGIGISPEHMKQMFTPFFTTKPVGVGTGLGLSICHRLLAAIGGAISVESKQGVGTSFRVALQPSQATETTRAASRHPPGHAPARRGSLLIVDDEPMIVSLVGKIVGADHDVVGVIRAPEALERIAQGERFDLILCDLMMPVMTGMELHASIQRIDPAQADAMVFITGGAFTPDARAFIETMPNRRLQKPFDARTLRSLINLRLG
jgi:CheY-like chemotaxis protein